MLTTANGFTTGRTVNISIPGTPGTLAAANGTTATYTGVITAFAPLIIGDPTNTGTVVLGGTNTYSVSTTIVSGATLRANSAVALSSASAFIVLGTLDLNGFSSQIGSLAGNGTVTNGDSVPVALTVGNDHTDTTFSGVLEDGTHSLSLTKVGAGTLTLSGANTYTGGTTVSGGALSVGTDGELGTGGGITLTGGKLVLNADGFTTLRT